MKVVIDRRSDCTRPMIDRSTCDCRDLAPNESAKFVATTLVVAWQTALYADPIDFDS